MAQDHNKNRDSTLCRSFPWSAPCIMIGRMTIPFSSSAPPSFLHSGRGAPPVIPPNYLHMRGRVILVLPPLSGSKGAKFRLWHFSLLARHIPENKMMNRPNITFSQWSRLILYVVQAPRDRTFFGFERRENAFAAISSLNAVIGNCEIRLAWAVIPNFAECKTSLTNNGKLVAQD